MWIFSGKSTFIFFKCRQVAKNGCHVQKISVKMRMKCHGKSKAALAAAAAAAYLQNLHMAVTFGEHYWANIDSISVAFKSRQNCSTTWKVVNSLEREMNVALKRKVRKNNFLTSFHISLSGWFCSAFYPKQ